MFHVTVVCRSLNQFLRIEVHILCCCHVRRVAVIAQQPFQEIYGRLISNMGANKTSRDLGVFLRNIKFIELVKQAELIKGNYIYEHGVKNKSHIKMF